MSLSIYPITIFYDGACSVCAREMERYRKKDKLGRLKFFDVNQASFDFRRYGLRPERLKDYIHAQDGQGKTVYGIDAFIWIWQAVGWRLLPFFVGFPLIKQVGKIFYRIFAKNRYLWGGREKLACSSKECEHTMV